MSDATIPTWPLYAGHEEVRRRYVELHDEKWVRKVERYTSVYEFARCFVDARRHKRKEETEAAAESSNLTNTEGESN